VGGVRLMVSAASNSLVGVMFRGFLSGFATGFDAAQSTLSNWMSRLLLGIISSGENSTDV
jgi:hypothetical protein